MNPSIGDPWGPDLQESELGKETVCRVVGHVNEKGNVQCTWRIKQPWKAVLTLFFQWYYSMKTGENRKNMCTEYVYRGWLNHQVFSAAMSLGDPGDDRVTMRRKSFS